MNINIEQLSYMINKQEVLKNFSATIFDGKITCLIGHNGSGKTTLIKCILGIIQNYTGSISFGKYDSDRGLIGVKLDYPPFDGGLSAKNNLKVINSIKESTLNENEEILEKFQIKNSLNKKVKNYSLGMWNKLGIYAALLGNPKLIVLDEPSNGLDISSRSYLQKLLVQEKNKGKTILLSTHDIHEVYALADYLICIKEGTLLTFMSKEEIRKNYNDVDNFIKEMKL